MERIKEPLLHITRRDGMPLWKSMLIRAGAVLIALVISSIFISAAAPNSQGFFGFFGSFFSGSFGTMRRLSQLLRETSMLLLVALALVIAFKMKFWNLGGNGQILMGCLASAMCLVYLGGRIPNGVLWLIMFVVSILAGAIWALLPALFKAFFNTNESLFTLMMNYIAMYLVAFFITHWYPQGSGAMPSMSEYALIVKFSDPSNTSIWGKTIPVVLAAVLVTIFIYCYLRYHKHGFEISIVGESVNTARYAGINVKKVIIRTLILSGALCGLVGFLLVATVNQMITTTMDGNMGFTGIIVAWMGKFDPLVMIGVSLFVNFLTRGMSQVCIDFGFTSEALSDTVVGLIYFFLIGCEFFISYKLHFSKGRAKKDRPDFMDPAPKPPEITDTTAQTQQENTPDAAEETA